jgi:uroporphyrinogen-III synthase
MVKPVSFSKPLVVVTRPTGGVCQLTKHLKAQQIDVLAFPMFKRVALEKQSDVRAIFCKLSEFAAILFTSPHSVGLFFEALKSEGSKRIESSIPLLAIGSATAKKIKALGYNRILTPCVANSESMNQFLEELTLSPRSKILYPKVNITRGLIEESLRRLGFELVSLPLYKLVPTNDEKLLQKCLHEMKKRHRFVLSFFSSSAFTEFLKRMEKIKESSSLLKKAVFAALGPVTEKTIVAQGYRVKIIPEEASAVSLAKAIQLFLNRK